MKAMLLLVAALAVSATGCFGGPRSRFGRECIPDSCGVESHGRCAPGTRDCDTPERIVVQGPKTTCVVEQQPCPTPCPTPTGSPPPVGAPPPPVGAPPAPIGAPPMMPIGAQPMMPMMMGFGGAPAFQAVNAQVRERTGLGFAIDYIKIPIPCIKPIAVQRPADVTFQMNAQQPVGYAPVGMAGYAPMPMGFAGGAMGMVPQATINYGQVTVPTQVPVGQAPPQQPPVGAAPPKSQQELLDECMRKLEAAQKKLQELEKKEPDKKEPDKK